MGEEKLKGVRMWWWDSEVREEVVARDFESRRGREEEGEVSELS